MSTITYRRLGPNNDPYFGQSQANYIADINAVAQAIYTRLLLFEGEWWSDTSDGTPYMQSILGSSGSARNIQAISLLVQNRILGTPYVTGIVNLNVSFNPNSRQVNFSATVQTQFGNVTVVNIPQPPSRALPL